LRKDVDALGLHESFDLTLQGPQGQHLAAEDIEGKGDVDAQAAIGYSRRQRREDSEGRVCPR